MPKIAFLIEEENGVVVITKDAYGEEATTVRNRSTSRSNKRGDVHHRGKNHNSRLHDQGKERRNRKEARDLKDGGWNPMGYDPND